MKKIVAAGGLVKNELNEYLMIYRRKMWDLPKGKLDANEDIEQCAIREVEEETGLKNLILGSLICVSKHQYFDKYEKQMVEKDTYWYNMVATKNQTITPQTEEEIEKVEWVAKDNLTPYLQNTFDSIKLVFEKHLEG
jgi:8-oxo-dGTP pyrophosphatase MutT (NUDIX family)